MAEMRHYEIVFLVHPDQSDKVPMMLHRYRTMVEGRGGKIHRLEDWGRRPLAYSIQRLHKAHYILMNIECDAGTIQEIDENFRFNDIILRYLIVRKKGPETEPSPIWKSMSAEDRKESEERIALSYRIGEESA